SNRPRLHLSINFLSGRVVCGPHAPFLGTGGPPFAKQCIALCLSHQNVGCPTLCTAKGGIFIHPPSPGPSPLASKKRLAPDSDLSQCQPRASSPGTMPFTSFWETSTHFDRTIIVT